jgi:hypothetical protein
MRHRVSETVGATGLGCKPATTTSSLDRRDEAVTLRSGCTGAPLYIAVYDIDCNSFIRGSYRRFAALKEHEYLAAKDHIMTAAN